MREHHGVDEADALGDPGRDRIGERAERARPEEKQSGRGQWKIETLEQPEHQQGLGDETAREGIDAEQRRELVDRAARWPERRLRRPLLAARVRDTAIKRPE